MKILHKVTNESLKKNRTRTIVTIIGVLLSTAMLAAITTFIASFQDYLLRDTIAGSGNWHAKVSEVGPDDAATLEKMPELKSVEYLNQIGYAPLEASQNPDKPYLFVAGLSDAMFDTLSVKLETGRLPQNDSEILIPAHLSSNGGVQVKLGQTLTLAVGARVDEAGATIWQQTAFLGEEESLKTESTKTYTVVGFCSRPVFEVRHAPGYTVITKSEDPSGHPQIAYLKFKQLSKVYATELHVSGGVEYNHDLLRYSGTSASRTFNATLYSLGAILVLLILFGSISLIYNAFAISVSERARQFGLLSSVGATRKQLYRSVLYEGMTIGLIGVPLGLLSGVAGIGVTLLFVKDLFSSFSSNVQMRLIVSPVALLIAAALAFLTIYISALIPARRASRTSAIEAIRQTSDLTIRSKQVRTGKWVYRLFGLEGELALKNFKRNKKRYRSTVLSLFMSVVLFVSASSFGLYLTKGSQSAIRSTDYDLSYHLAADRSADAAQFLALLSKTEGVTNASWYRSELGYLQIDKADLDERFAALLDAQGATQENRTGCMVAALRDADFDAFLRSIGQDPADYAAGEAPPVIAVNAFRRYNPETDRYENGPVFREGSQPDLTFVIQDYNEETEETSERLLPLKVGAVTEKVPFGLAGLVDSLPLLIVPDRVSQSIFEDSSANYQLIFSSEDSARSYTAMQSALRAAGLATEPLRDEGEAERSTRNLLMLISVFSYGFIALISLITVANVFNTISTNIHLRRREMAMLSSVGMTKKGFFRMMNFECLIYGLKALCYGLPVAVFVSFLLYRSIGNAVDTAFLLPWGSICVSAVSVFLVVFITMLYAMHKIRKQNIIETIKDENL